MMVLYVIIGLVALILLIAAYRSFGLPAAPVAEPVALLVAVLAAADGVLSDVDRGAPVHGARKRLDGCAQQLERLESASLAEVTAQSRQLLSRAVEELGWALRLRESASPDPGGLGKAFDELRASSVHHLDGARALLAVSAGAKERDGSA